MRQLQIRGFLTDQGELPVGKELLKGGWGCCGVVDETGAVSCLGLNLAASDLQGHVSAGCFGWETLFLLTHQGTALHRLSLTATPEQTTPTTEPSSTIDIPKWTAVQKIDAGSASLDLSPEADCCLRC